MPIYEIILGIIGIYFVTMVITTLYNRGLLGKMIRSGVTVVAFIVLGVLVVSIDYEQSWWRWLVTRSICAVFIVVAGLHIGMIYQLRNQYKREKH